MSSLHPLARSVRPLALADLRQRFAAIEAHGPGHDHLPGLPRVKVFDKGWDFLLLARR